MNSALLWLTVTLAAFALAERMFERVGRIPLANPVLIAVLLVSGAVVATGTSYDVYMQGGGILHFLLGPVAVALALPLWDNRARIRRALLPMAAALAVGSVVAMGSAVLIGRALGLRAEVLISLIPKSATAPVAIGISERLGGVAPLTAVLVILTGITGAVLAIPMLRALGLHDRRAQGFATGIAAHGIGTAQALRVDATAGAFAGIGMGLNALLTAILAPIALHLL